ncbi:MAG: 30S ribosomal protein S20 [Deltaproteobacteria bacterium]|nr:MAG: 30S ribosomal protein S20 [Deltaproteobacteria bacterium]
MRHKSTIKRHIQSQKKRLLNRSLKSSLNTKLKKIFLNINEESVQIGQKLLAIASRKRIIHWKAAAKKTSKLMRKQNLQSNA